jgi:peroxiredoxin
MAQIAVGVTLPDGTLDWCDDSDQHQSVTIHGLAKGKKVVLVGVPGAFTPTCRSFFFFIFPFIYALVISTLSQVREIIQYVISIPSRYLINLHLIQPRG